MIDNDRGVHMRPMPGMIGLIASNSNKVFISCLGSFLEEKNSVVCLICFFFSFGWAL